MADFYRHWLEKYSHRWRGFSLFAFADQLTGNSKALMYLYDMGFSQTFAGNPSITRQLNSCPERNILHELSRGPLVNRLDRFILNRFKDISGHGRLVPLLHAEPFSQRRIRQMIAHHPLQASMEVTGAYSICLIHFSQWLMGEMEDYPCKAFGCFKIRSGDPAAPAFPNERACWLPPRARAAPGGSRRQNPPSCSLQDSALGFDGRAASAPCGFVRHRPGVAAGSAGYIYRNLYRVFVPPPRRLTIQPGPLRFSWKWIPL